LLLPVGNAAHLLIQRLVLDQFKAFERYTLRLRGDSYLAGPNNAGKSTLLAALRTAARMLRHASRRRASDTFFDRGRRVPGHPFSLGQFGLVEENLRHEFRENEARMTVTFRGGMNLTAVWPADPDILTPFFYFHQAGMFFEAPAEVVPHIPSIGTVPVLSPIDHAEAVLTSDKYIRDNLDGRLASRHFRNQLMLLSSEDPDSYAEYLEYTREWLPEVRLRSLETRTDQQGQFVDLYYTELGSRVEKEAFWAGDGIQIILQLLLHVFRLRDHDVVILDEPDVFLHPDLQRRMVRLVEDLPGQAITATHSPEVLAEADPEAVVWIDKARRQSIRSPEPKVLSELLRAIGTQFNIRLARALRTKVAIFVEGDDMKILRHLATAVGAEAIAHEEHIAVIPLRGYSNWDRVEPFAWLVRDLLESSVEVFVVLDRDNRSAKQVSAVKRRLKNISVRAHIWKRKELENYVLEPSVIARLTGESEEETRGRLTRASEDLKETLITRAIANRSLGARPEDRDGLRDEVRAEVDKAWPDIQTRLTICPPKDVLANLNKELAAENKRALTFVRLAREMDAQEVAEEVTHLFEKIEDAT
jgi:predicted ATPase